MMMNHLTSMVSSLAKERLCASTLQDHQRGQWALFQVFMDLFVQVFIYMYYLTLSHTCPHTPSHNLTHIPTQMTTCDSDQLQQGGGYHANEEPAIPVH